MPLNKPLKRSSLIMVANACDTEWYLEDRSGCCRRTLTDIQSSNAMAVVWNQHTCVKWMSNKKARNAWSAQVIKSDGDH